jgi:hypothetical protein
VESRITTTLPMPKSISTAPTPNKIIAPEVIDVTKVSPYVKLAEFLQNFEFSGLHTRKDFKLEIYNTVNITRFLICNLIRHNISVCYTDWTIVQHICDKTLI